MKASRNCSVALASRACFSGNGTDPCIESISSTSSISSLFNVASCADGAAAAAATASANARRPKWDAWRPRAARGLAAFIVGLLWASNCGCATALDPVLVAPGIYLLRGANGAPSEDNLGRTGNVTFIVGPRGVVVVQTGVTYRHGADLLAAVARTTDRPIRLAIITHPQPPYVFGAAAFQE